MIVSDNASIGLTSSRYRTDRHRGLRQIAADLALVSTGLVVIGLFSISSVTLEYFGFSYYTSGGDVLSKFHPSTILAVTAIGLRCLSARQPIRAAWHLATDDPGVVMLLGATLIMAAAAVLIARTPVTGLVDTFVLPAFCYLLLRDLNPDIKRWLAIAIALILCVNAAMAVFELVMHRHLITVDFPAGVSADPTRTDAVFDWRAEFANDWRAAALLGHPLVNGLIVGCWILCLAVPGSRWMTAPIKGVLIFVQSISMFAFGARTSLVLTVVLATLIALQQGVSALGRGARLKPQHVVIAVGVAAIAFIAMDLLYESGLLDRTIERFTDDRGSADTRLTMLQLFDHFSFADLLLAPDQDVVSTWTRLYGLEFGVESSWVGLILNYGLVITTMTIVALLAFSRSVISASGRGAFVVLLFYFISVSGTASISGKTTSFAMVVSMILLFLPFEPKRTDREPFRDVRGSVER